MTTEHPDGGGEQGAATPVRRFARSRPNSDERLRLREGVREANFPIAIRGYDRAAVDQYVKNVNRVIAELEISASPEAAVRHALDEVSEETRGLLERAHETAEEITARSRSRADDRIQAAEREAQEVREAAARDAEEMREAAARDADEMRSTAKRETEELREMAAREAHGLRETAAQEAHQLRATAQREADEMRTAAESRVAELDRDADELWRERRRLIKDMSTVAQQQLEIADAAAARFAREPEPAAGEPGPDAETAS